MARGVVMRVEMRVQVRVEMRVQVRVEMRVQARVEMRVQVRVPTADVAYVEQQAPYNFFLGASRSSYL